jgi:RNA polymerase nonessential primary-like sigma factor
MPMFPSPSLTETAEQRDIRLIREWKGAMGYQKDQKLGEILKSMGGVIGSVVNQYRAAPVPFQTLELEAKRQTAMALKEWQPGMGTKPSTFLRTRLQQRLYRYVTEHQNTARIPEEHVRRIGSYNSAMADLTDRFGREPSTHEIADHMGIPVRQVSRLRKMLRSDLTQNDENSLIMDDYRHDPEYEHAMMGYYSLTEQEKSVFDYLTGSHGQAQMNATQVAAKMKLSKQRVSNLRKSIGKKLGKYMGDARG